MTAAPAVLRPSLPLGQAGATAGSGAASDAAPGEAEAEAEAERRFGGLRRLYGDAGYTKLRGARVGVVGLGGVGSWAAEALARSGVALLVLIDLDQVAASNINRQVQALGSTVGQAKVDALCDRIADIHPQCAVVAVEDFVTPENWPALLPTPVDVLIDACDQVRAKAVLAAWGLQHGVPVVCVGAAGGKRLPQRVEIDDLASATHDPLLAALRGRLRKAHGAARSGPIGIRCVLSREPVAAPPLQPAAGAAQALALPATDGDGDGDDDDDDDANAAAPASKALAPPPTHDVAAVAPTLTRPGAPLACHGYGSSVAVTATFGMVAAAEAVEQLLRRLPAGSQAVPA